MILPDLSFWLSMATVISFYLLVAMTLNLQFGYTGIPNFGLVLGVGGGGLAATWVVRLLPQWILGIAGNPLADNAVIVDQITATFQHDPLFAVAILLITLLVATLVGAAVGTFASLPAIRLKGDYLAIILWVLGYMVEILGLNDYSLAGGSNGVIIPDPFVEFGVNRFLVVTLITIGVCIGFFLYLQRLSRSPLARSLRAIRDNETTAASVGRDLIKSRLKVMAIGAAVGGLAGGLIAFYGLGVSGSTFNRVDWTYYPWLIVILGGVGSDLGTVLGAIIIISIQQFVVFYEPMVAAFLPFNVVYLQYLAFGVALVLIMKYRLQGILPEKSGRTTRSKPG